MAKILDRKDDLTLKELEKSVKNRFKWDWLQRSVKIETGGETGQWKDLHVTAFDIGESHTCLWNIFYIHLFFHESVSWKNSSKFIQIFQGKWE